jgi:hypothetical protein
MELIMAWTDGSITQIEAPMFTTFAEAWFKTPNEHHQKDRKGDPDQQGSEFCLVVDEQLVSELKNSSHARLPLPRTAA